MPNNYQYNKNSYRNFKYNNLNFYADISDYMAHYIYFGFKDLSLENMLNYIKPNDVIIDVGTNIGCSLLNFANKTGSGGKVYGFEPDSYNFTICKKNISLNTLKNIELHNIGLGNEQGKF
ncbi:MAG: FkbM family methyltransferase, partial [Bacteroidia bacterium]